MQVKYCLLLFVFLEFFSLVSIAGEVTLSEDARAAAPVAWALSLPTSAEFFVAVSKQERPNWSLAQRAEIDNRVTDRSQIALSLGVLFSDAYLAIEKQDGQMVKNITRDIVSQAEKLHASEGLRARERNINTFTERNNWNVLRAEVDATQNEIVMLLQSQNDQNLVPLIRVGEWLRTLNTFATLQKKSLQPNSLSWLLQKSLIESQLNLISELPQKDTPNQWRVAVIAALEEVLNASSSLNLPPLLSVTPDQLDLILKSTSDVLAVIGAVAEQPELSPKNVGDEPTATPTAPVGDMASPTPSSEPSGVPET
ncbi:MAG: hypothetical protein ACK5LK_06230 [Chthoniobacterales bacterium]